MDIFDAMDPVGVAARASKSLAERDVRVDAGFSSCAVGVAASWDVDLSLRLLPAGGCGRANFVTPVPDLAELLELLEPFLLATAEAAGAAALLDTGGAAKDLAEGTLGGDVARELVDADVCKGGVAGGDLSCAVDAAAAEPWLVLIGWGSGRPPEVVGERGALARPCCCMLPSEEGRVTVTSTPAGGGSASLCRAGGAGCACSLLLPAASLSEWRWGCRAAAATWA
eukprot:CAMPEP_0177641740 /NCGR_PEP_ID=MMETSP0447-20121125/7222_1 /TAXON_ID=0 /ORGANISM="Stygamoeba regulata, Strain BSH-02190019" /LENGTH=225 /DNA_ID=CAMNT_0019143867 /DNA_START=160 /DNA_END=834 /DNA_ORIENTATION=-